MNRAKKVVVVGLLVLACALLWFVRGRSRDAFGHVDAQKSHSSHAPAQRNNSSVSRSEGGAKESDRERIEGIANGIESLNVPIDFWGKIVDQAGVPVSGVEVGYTYTTEHGKRASGAWSATKNTKGRAVSDGGGSFVIRGLRGTYLNIDSLRKDGYVTSNRFLVSGMAYNYAGHTSEGKFVPDERRPVLFVMLRTDASEELLEYNGRLRLPSNGTAVRFSVVAGRQVTNGELQFAFHRDPEIYASGQLKWGMYFEVIGGAVQEINEKEGSSYLAPLQGYQSGLAWTLEGAKSVYFRTAEGRYGRIRIEVHPDDEGDSVRCVIEGFLNPSGSRNLEHTPQQNWIRPLPLTNPIPKP